MRRTLIVPALIAVVTLVGAGSQALAEGAASDGRVAAERSGLVVFEGLDGLYLVSAAGGAPRKIAGTRVGDGDPAWSPDGGRIAFDRVSTNDPDDDRDIYVMSADGSGVRQLTFAPDDDGWPRWAPHGRTLAFVSKRDGPRSVYAISVRTGAARRVVRMGQSPDWTRDGRIIYAARSPGPQAGLVFTVKPYGADKRPLPTQPGRAMTVSTSSDGTRIAMQWCVQPCGGGLPDYDVYVASVDGSAATPVVRANGRLATSPGWSPDDSWIVYEYPDARARDSNLFLIRPDGTGRTQLTRVEYACCADWSSQTPPTAP